VCLHAYMYVCVYTDFADVVDPKYEAAHIYLTSVCVRVFACVYV